MAERSYESWGRYPKATHDIVKFRWRHSPLPFDSLADGTFLPFGNGRSYGDVCLNDGGTLLDCRGLNRFVSFDVETGVLRCESGVLLSQILDVIVPRGWFVPVTPGTRFVTVGGAIANDVHGKNHHRAGTFGCHIRCFELLRSNGNRYVCSREENPDLFRATIGGLGLTGVITWAEIQLKPIKGAYIYRETVRFANLDEFFELAEDSDRKFEYSVAWIDCLGKGSQLGRGIYTRGSHSDRPCFLNPTKRSRRMSIPFDPPVALVNGVTLRLFNACYYNKAARKTAARTLHFRSFFYPLDSLSAWNRIYGSAGFLQYQCVVPREHGRSAISEILARIAKAGTGSFLAVLKVFGDLESPGLLSFPRPGPTLALDFPNAGKRTLDLLDHLDEVVRSVGGAVNPSKDARMSSRDFLAAYPRYTEFAAHIDPGISSSFRRRVMPEN